MLFFFCILLCCGCGLSSVSDLYAFPSWYPASMQYDRELVPRERMSQLMGVLDNAGSDDLERLEHVFSEVMVPFLPTKCYASAYDDEQQRKGNRKKMKQAVSERA